MGHAFSKTSPIPREAACSHAVVSSGGWRAGLRDYTNAFSHSHNRCSPGGGNARGRCGLPLVYVALDHELWTDFRQRGLPGLARICQFPGDRSFSDFSLKSGVVLQGLLHELLQGRSRHLLGAAFAYTHLCNPVANALRRFPKNQPARFVPHSESIPELTYLAPLSDHWEVYPPFIFHPDADAEVDRAVVFSLRTILRF